MSIFHKMKGLALVLAPVLGLGGLPAVATAEDSGSELMRKGFELFLDGLQEEMAPGMEALVDLWAEAGPSLQGFLEEMGPALAEMMAQVQDWTAYHPPEILPNGDIILRRKTPEELPQEEDAPLPEGQIEL